MRLADVKSYYGQRYTSIFNTFNNHFKNTFDFDIDEFGVNLDLTLIDESIELNTKYNLQAVDYNSINCLYFEFISTLYCKYILIKIRKIGA